VTSRLTKNDESCDDDDRPWFVACKRVADKACCTAREQEVLVQLSLGRTPEDIAQRLSISMNTVRSHTRGIYSKLDIHSRQELVVIVNAERNDQSHSMSRIS
jgi:DNA-binding CsgD family transcriptional regulator